MEDSGFPGDPIVLVNCEGPDDDECPCAGATLGDRGYYFCVDSVPWAMARAKCQAIGFDLAHIGSQEEQDLVWENATAAVGNDDWWIGLTDRATEGSWVWEDGTPLGEFNAWADTQPDAGGPGATVDEDCVEMGDLNAGRWNDLSCDTPYLSFICEGAI